MSLLLCSAANLWAYNWPIMTLMSLSSSEKTSKLGLIIIEGLEKIVHVFNRLSIEVYKNSIKSIVMCAPSSVEHKWVNANTSFESQHLFTLLTITWKV